MKNEELEEIKTISEQTIEDHLKTIKEQYNDYEKLNKEHDQLQIKLMKKREEFIEAIRND